MLVTLIEEVVIANPYMFETVMKGDFWFPYLFIFLAVNDEKRYKKKLREIDNITFP